MGSLQDSDEILCVFRFEIILRLLNDSYGILKLKAQKEERDEDDGSSGGCVPIRWMC